MCWQPKQLLRVLGVDNDEGGSAIPWKSAAEDATVVAAGAKGATL